MKKAFLLIAACILSFSTYAQFRFGGGVTYGTDINNAGLNLGGVYQIDEFWEAGLTYTHFFKNNDITWDIIDMDAHYNFAQSGKAVFYGVAGISLTFWTVEIPEQNWMGFYVRGSSITGSDAGLNLGAGSRIGISSNLFLSPDLRLTIIDGSYARLSLAIQYQLPK